MDTTTIEHLLSEGDRLEQEERWNLAQQAYTEALQLLGSIEKTAGKGLTLPSFLLTGGVLTALTSLVPGVFLGAFAAWGVKRAARAISSISLQAYKDQATSGILRTKAKYKE